MEMISFFIKYSLTNMLSHLKRFFIKQFIVMTYYSLYIIVIYYKYNIPIYKIKLIKQFNTFGQ